MGLLLLAAVSNAQSVALKLGEETKTPLVKNGEAIGFVSGGNSYFVTKKFEQAVTNYYLESYDASGGALAETPLEINMGVFNNTYGIHDVIGFGNTACALVEHLDKASAKNTLLAREIDDAGTVSKDETDLMEMSFEKLMNPGINHAAASADQKVLAVVGELPYVKEQPAKLKIALYDPTLKRTSEGEITLPGEDTRNKTIRVAVANDGTVYLIKQTMTKNAEIALAVYQYAPNTPLKEYTFEMDAPNQFFSYAYTVTPNNELVLGGTYYERKTLTVGEKTAVGVFYFTNRSKAEKVFKTVALDKPVENLTARKILLNGNTVFLAAEQYKEEKVAPPASTPAANFEYSYTYTHKSEYVIALDTEGNKKFELGLAKDFTAKDFNKQYLSAYFISNGKFTIVYNDLAKKYTGDPSYGTLIPVLVQITNEGLMQSPVVFTDKLKLPYYSVLYPAFAVQNAENSFTFLLKNSDRSQYINLKIN